MALLDAVARARTVAQWMRDNKDACGFDKTALAAAVASADQWVEDNTASFVAALPQPFRGASNAAQKTAILVYVLMRRGGKLRAEEDG